MQMCNGHGRLPGLFNYKKMANVLLLLQLLIAMFYLRSRAFESTKLFVSLKNISLWGREQKGHGQLHVGDSVWLPKHHKPNFILHKHPFKYPSQIFKEGGKKVSMTPIFSVTNLAKWIKSFRNWNLRSLLLFTFSCYVLEDRFPIHAPRDNIKMTQWNFLKSLNEHHACCVVHQVFIYHPRCASVAPAVCFTH